MGFFGKLFDKKECSICGGEIGLLGNRKLEDGNCCKECAKKLSPWFDDRRHSTVEQIKRQLAAREANRQKLETWEHNMVFGEYQKLYVSFVGRIPDTIVISSASNYKEDNADIIPLHLVNSCNVDIRESHRELKQKNAQGEQVSYNPPRYEYSYDFYIKMTIMGIEYIDDVSFRLNRNTLKLESVQRGNGRGLLFSQAFDPMHYPEYREYKSICDTVYQIISFGQKGVPYQEQSAGVVSAGSADSVPAMLNKIRNASDVESALNAYMALSAQILNHSDRDEINRQAAEALAAVKNRETRQAVAAAPVQPSGVWICPNCGSENTKKFCQGCGSMRPAPAPTPAKWKCFCGTENTGKFCAECGTAQFSLKDITCSECSWTAEPGDVVLPTFCPNCGKRFNADDI